ncbi:MAG: VCBS repeat-containing protein [Verrucomicrobiota bacterium]
MGLIVGESLSGDTVMWADVDNDGWPELSRTVASECIAGSSWTNQLLHLDSEGKFYLMDIGEMKRGTEGMTLAVWGDFDNDGLLDAVVGAKRGLLGLYRNLAGQGFTNMASAFSTPVTNAGLCG